MRSCGFNFLWMYSYDPQRKPEGPDLAALDFMAAHKLSFVRIPTDYRFWTHDFDYRHPLGENLKVLDNYIAACDARDLHVSFNMHRGPGYCINSNHLEKHNLWLDPVAQDGFCFQWEYFAKRYQHIPAERLSFDLLNEPPRLGQYGMSGADHDRVMQKACEAIWSVSPDRPLVLDGLDGGNTPLQAFKQPGITQSLRAYQPMAISHYLAPWCEETKHIVEPPQYPGVLWDGHAWDKEALREHFAPWRKIEAEGVRVHVGEMGCYNKTSNDVALAWFADVFSLLKEFGWGYALWNFKGDFGLAEHGRPGARYRSYNGFLMDVDLLELYLSHRPEPQGF